jgi:dethiobiotin synthetase
MSTTPPLRGLFVTGTDTGVGKTTVATALLRCARRRGLRPIPYKPAETGCDPEPLDARALWEAAGKPVALSEVCPFPMRLPAAPALAAAAEGIHLDLDQLVDRAQTLAAAGDFLLVEGAGGLLVPYAGKATAADLAARLGLPLLVVARTALGTVNHTSLTVREARRQGLVIAGILFNRTLADPGPHEAGNADLVEAVTGLRILGTFPHLDPTMPVDPERAADMLSDCLGPAGLERLLGPTAG